MVCFVLFLLSASSHSHPQPVSLLHESGSRKGDFVWLLNCKPSSERRKYEWLSIQFWSLEEEHTFIVHHSPQKVNVSVLSRGSLCDANNFILSKNATHATWIFSSLAHFLFSLFLIFRCVLFTKDSLFFLSFFSFWRRHEERRELAQKNIAGRVSTRKEQATNKETNKQWRLKNMLKCLSSSTYSTVVIC